MAHKAGYQRNESKLHHAQPFAIRAKEENLIVVSATLAGDMVIPGCV